MNSDSLMVMEICHGHHALRGITKYSIFALVPLELTFILLFLRYWRLLKDKSIVLLLNLNIINIFAFFLLLVEYKHENLHCQIGRIIRHVIPAVEVMLVVGLIIKSYTNLYYPNYVIKPRVLTYTVYAVYGFIAGSSIVELASSCLPCQTKDATAIFYTFVSVSFMTMSIFYNCSWLYEKGASQFFRTKDVDFLLSNIYLICTLPLMVNQILINVFDKYELLYPYYDVSVIIYSLRPVYFFVVLFKFNSDFNLYFRKLFSCCKQEKDTDRVVFNNSITIINVYSSSKI